MRVVMITGHDVWGSLKEFSPLKNILLALGEEGHEVVLITHDKTNDHSTNVFGDPVEFFHDNVKIRRFHIPGDTHMYPLLRKIPIVGSIYNRIRMEFLFPILSFWHGRKVSKAKRPDLVYGYEVFAAFPAFLLAKILGLRLVLRFQGTLLAFLFQKATRNLLGKWGVIRHWFHCFALRIPADLIIMTDDGTQGESILRQLGNKSRLKFWRNGLDRDRLQNIGKSKGQLREELNLPQDANILFSASRLAAWKRFDRIINAIPLIREKVPEFLYVIVGNGVQREELEALVDSLGIGNNVRFEGHLEHEIVIKQMHASDVFISMNDWTNAGNPTMEAMICRKPIVTYDIGDTSKLIEDGVNGRLLTTDAPTVVAEAVSELLLDIRLREEFSKNAGEFAEANLWTWKERMGAEIAELEALAGNGGR